MESKNRRKSKVPTAVHRIIVCVSSTLISAQCARKNGAVTLVVSVQHEGKQISVLVPGWQCCCLHWRLQPLHPLPPPLSAAPQPQPHLHPALPQGPSLVKLRATSNTTAVCQRISLIVISNNAQRDVIIRRRAFIFIIIIFVS